MGVGELLCCRLPPGDVGRFDAWFKTRACQIMMRDDNLLYFVIAHHPETASTGGADWPCQLTRGTVVQLMQNKPVLGAFELRIATGLEHLQAMG